MRTAMLPLACVLIACALSACAGATETGNPAVPVDIQLDLRSSAPSAVGIRTGAADTVIEQAWFALGEPLFLDEGQCGSLEDFPVGPTSLVADLASPDARIELQVASERYCGLVLRLQQDSTELPDDAPSELEDHSIVLTGTRADGTPFMVLHAEQDEIEVIADDGSFEVEEGGPLLLLAFDVAALMRDVALDDAEVDTDGVIRIDAMRNTPLHEAFDANLECSLDLYFDRDEDGQLDAALDPHVARCAPQ